MPNDLPSIVAAQQRLAAAEEAARQAQEEMRAATAEAERLRAALADAEAARDTRTREAMAALEIAAHLPPGRCHAFIRALVEGAEWATDDVRRYLTRSTT